MHVYYDSSRHPNDLGAARFVLAGVDGFDLPEIDFYVMPDLVAIGGLNRTDFALLARRNTT